MEGSNTLNKGCLGFSFFQGRGWMLWLKIGNCDFFFYAFQLPAFLASKGRRCVWSFFNSVVGKVVRSLQALMENASMTATSASTSLDRVAIILRRHGKGGPRSPVGPQSGQGACPNSLGRWFARSTTERGGTGALSGLGSDRRSGSLDLASLSVLYNF